MENSDADRNLLFGLLALQNGLVDQVQLVAAFQSWTLQKDRPLADHLVEGGALDIDQRGVIDAMVGLHLKKHGGSPAKSLAGIPATILSTEDTLAQLADPERARTLWDAEIGPDPELAHDRTVAFDIAAAAPKSVHPELAPDRTVAFDPSAAPDACSILEGLGTRMRTVISHVSLQEPDSEPEGRGPAAASGNATRFPHSRAGRYQLLGEIAHGGMGSVLRGRDMDLGRDLAVKVLLDTHSRQSVLVNRFLEEAQICGQLQHPGVVPVYDLGILSDDRPFFAMKLVKGQTLAALLAGRSSPADDLPRFLSIFEAICQTMAYAHARGVIHRDLKPANVMVGAFGEVQVMDWGLAKILPRDGPKKEGDFRPVSDSVIANVGSNSGRDSTQVGSAMGTPSYMAPEQARGEIEAIDRRADVFALGSILCEILTGGPAFSGNRSFDIVLAAGRGDTAAALLRLNQCGADEELLSLARDCLAPEAGDRPADAGVVAGRMTAYLAGVQERLRGAELSRAAADARAEEEVKRRELAERLTEEERGRAEEATRRAALERQRRKLQLGLAASLLFFSTAAGLGTTYYVQQRQARIASLDQVLGRASTLLDQAREHAGDPARWRVAMAAIEQADRSLDGDPLAQKRVSALRAAASDGAGAAERDRRLMDRLVDIRSAEADDPGGYSTDAAYAAAFHEAALDIAGLSPDEAAGRIRARPAEVATALAVAVDDWAAIRRERRKDGAGASRLSALAAAVDPDAWRVGLRRALDLPDPAARLAALRGMAKDAPFDTLGPISLDLLGRELRVAGDAASAETVLRRAQQLHPDDVWINYDLARALEKLARRDEAIRYDMAARAIRRETAHELAHLLGARGEQAEEVAIFEDLKRTQPNSGRHLGCLGRALKSLGRTEEAATVLKEAEAANRAAVEQRPGDALAHFSLGFALYMQGKVDDAVVECRAAIGIQPETAEFHDTLCELLGKQGKLADAIAEYRAAIRIQPEFANAYNTMGDILFSLKQDYGPAAALFRKATRLQPDNAVYHNNLGLALQKDGKLDEAIVEYRTAGQLKPSFSDAHLGVGEILELQGKLDEAIVEYRSAARLDPHYADAHNSLARALVKRPDRDVRERSEGLEHARQAVALSPDDGIFRGTLAVAEYRAGHWALSTAAAEKSIALAKSVDGPNGFFLAMALWQQGQKDRSRSFFDQAVAWTKANDPKKADLLLFWREAAKLLGQPGPDAPPAAPLAS